MIDLHAHILPEVDDGPKNLDLCFRMLKQAYDHGITTVCTTPHICGRIDPEFEQKIVSSRNLNVPENTDLPFILSFVGEPTDDAEHKKLRFDFKGGNK